MRSIGLTPQSIIVDVTANDTAFATMRVSRVQVLEAVHTDESAIRSRYAADYEQRKRADWGKYLDSTVHGNLNIMPGAFAQFPSTIIQKGLIY